MSKAWTKEEIDFLKINFSLQDPAWCASKLPGRSIPAIRGKACQLKLKGKNNHYSNGMTHEEYENKLLDKEIDHFPIEKYNGYDTPIQHECLQGHVTLRAPNSVLRGNDCQVCIGHAKKTSVSYKQELKDAGIKYIPIEEYINTDTPINHECPKCSTVWKSRPSHVLRGHGCPKCKRPGGYNTTFFNNNPEIANSPGIMYVVVLIDKETKQRIAYKIGITKGTSDKDTFKRFAQFGAYEARILKTVKGTLKQVFELEQKLHAQWHHKQLVPDKKFGGRLECFELDPEIIRSVPKTV